MFDQSAALFVYYIVVLGQSELYGQTDTNHVVVDEAISHNMALWSDTSVFIHNNFILVTGPMESISL